jgi:polyferredoxin/tetratricopeptide (TPR) repeat protein
MANSSAGGRNRCVHPSMVVEALNSGARSRPRSVALPVVATDNSMPPRAAAGASPQTIRPSKNGKRRAIVLAVVQGLMIAHIVVWLLGRHYGWFGGGRTTTPIEPSESMEFSKDGVINAGLIFFAIALLSTLILGRWFCGWGCHVVLLQDLCGWIMKKFGVRPRAFRSRFLMYVPLILALYMFIWPAAYRWGVLPVQQWLAAHTTWVSPPPTVSPWQPHMKLTTREFWATFPGVLVAIPFLGVCGFATVYFLGAKGFCTYGCPYGGFFAPLDKFATGRIRVTDACEGCGHCTAVCTSNVRVHEEVREYGMVVDPGCMKCLDCVSVCPNDALYFGFGKPAVAKGAAKNQSPIRKFDLTLGEEFLFSGVFLGTFMAVRGVYALVPMLMAAGVAGCVTFIAWKAWRMARDANVSFHRFQLKLRGSVRPAGWVFALLAAATMAMVAHSGVVNAAHAWGGWHDDRVLADPQRVFGGAAGSIDEPTRVRAAQALRGYRIASAMREGGCGLSANWQNAIDIRRAWLHCVRNEFAQAETIMRRAMQRDPSEPVANALALILRSSNDEQKISEAMALYEQSLTDNLDYGFAMLADYEPFALEHGRLSQVIAIHEARLVRDPDNLPSLRGLSILRMQMGKLDDGLALNARWIAADPHSSEAHRMRGLALADLNNMGQAIESMRRAVKENPRDLLSLNLLADLLEATGQRVEAAKVRETIMAHAPAPAAHDSHESGTSPPGR